MKQNNIKVAKQLIAMAREMLAEEDEYLVCDVTTLKKSDLDKYIEGGLNTAARDFEGAEHGTGQSVYFDEHKVHDLNTNTRHDIREIFGQEVRKVIKAIKDSRIYGVDPQKDPSDDPADVARWLKEKGTSQINNTMTGNFTYYMQVSGKIESQPYIVDGYEDYGRFSVIIEWGTGIYENAPGIWFDIKFWSQKNDTTYDVYKAWKAFRTSPEMKNFNVLSADSNGRMSSDFRGVLDEMVKSGVEEFLNEVYLDYADKVASKIEKKMHVAFWGIMEALGFKQKNPFKSPYSLT